MQRLTLPNPLYPDFADIELHLSLFTLLNASFLYFYQSDLERLFTLKYKIKKTNHSTPVVSEVMSSNMDYGFRDKPRLGIQPKTGWKINRIAFSCCRSQDRTMELLKRISLFKSQKKPFNWKFETFSTMMVLIGFFLVIYTGIQLLVSVDPKSAFMTSTRVKSTEPVCANFTCGALYCMFSQPHGCEPTVIFLKRGESGELCNTLPGCNWDAEVVTESNYDSRSTCVYIISSTGKPSYFAQLENNKRQFIDVTKYITYHDNAGDTTIEWSTTDDSLSQSMSSCGITHPELIDSTTRCGAYNVYISDIVYKNEVVLKYQLEQGNNQFKILTGLLTVFMTYYYLTYLYGETIIAKRKVDRKHID